MRTPAPDIIAAARAADRKYGVFASVSLAQWALESGWGQYCTGKFNFFGIKAAESQGGTLCWTHEVVEGKSVACQARFRDFASLEEAFDAHAALIALGRPYAEAMAVKNDLESFVRAMAKHYATDPAYASKLLAIIHGNELTRFDVGPLSPAPDLEASRIATEKALGA